MSQVAEQTRATGHHRQARIYCDAATRNAATAAVEFDEHAPIAVKGKVEKVPIFGPFECTGGS